MSTNYIIYDVVADANGSVENYQFRTSTAATSHMGGEGESSRIIFRGPAEVSKNGGPWRPVAAFYWRKAYSMSWAIASDEKEKE